MLAEDASDSFLYFALAKEYEKIDEVEAIVQFELLRDKDPNYVGLYYHLGKLYERRSELDLAKECYQKGIKVGKELADFHAISELNTALIELGYE